MSLDGKEFHLVDVSYCSDFCHLRVDICLRWDIRDSEVCWGLRIIRQINHWEVIWYRGAPEKTKRWKFKCWLFVPKWEKQEYNEIIKRKKQRRNDET